MFFKKIKTTFLILLLTISILPSRAFAYSDYILAGGENVGIQIQSKGIIIVGTYEVNGIDPAKKAGLKAGDTIFKINQVAVSNIEEMIAQISSSSSKEVAITYTRNQKNYEATLEIIKEDEKVYKTGLYVKDAITGIGTLTFIDPATKIFGALGHEVAEQTTGIMLEIKDGKIFSSNVTSIDRSENGEPGSKNATLNKNDEKGTILENTQNGIFGKYTEKLPNTKLYKVATPEEIKLDKAEILTVTEGNTIETYQIEILKINQNEAQKTKNILFEIKDEKLLEKTGGVVQGMSGSPIIQNDKIIGAVTHVVVNHPNRGYGIFITNMLEEAEN